MGADSNSAAATKSGQRHRYLTVIAVVLAIVLLDAATKKLVRDELGPSSDRHELDLAGDAISLRFLENDGIAFGLFEGGGPAIWIAVMVAVSVLLLAIFRHAREMTTEMAVAFGLILGGAIGNLVDRLADGRVTDFVDVWKWPVFNVADAAITIGGIALVWTIFGGLAPSKNSVGP